MAFVSIFSKKFLLAIVLIFSLQFNFSPSFAQPAPYSKKQVIEVQTILKKKGYYKGITNGIYATSTIDAIKAFQKNNNIPVTGSLGAITMITLSKETSKNATAPQAVVKNSNTAVPVTTTKPKVTAPIVSNTTLPKTLTANFYIGAKGAQVLLLQSFLKTSGYFDLIPTGYYGPVTAKAVSLFQKSNNIETTGTPGPITKKKINSLLALSSGGVVLPKETTPVVSLPGFKTLTVTTSNGGGVISNPSGIACGLTCSSSFSDNQVVTLIALPNSGYVFSNWSGVCSNATSTCNLNMFDNYSVIASFIVATSTPIVSGVGGGVVGGGSASTPDTTAPTTPTSLLVSSVASTSVSLSWSASTDAVGVTAYRVYRNDVLLGTSGVTTYTSTGLSTSTLYSFNVSAIDAAGNASATSTSVSTTTLSGIDTTAPSVPTSLSFSLVSTSTLTLSWASSTDDTAVTAYRIYRNGSFRATTTSALYNDTGLSTSTLYTYNIAAFDAAGNFSATSTSAGTTTLSGLDLTAPSTPSSLTITSIATSTISLSWASSTDAFGVTAYRLYRNNSFLATSTAITYTDTSLATGTLYTYNVAAFDAAGNFSATSTSVATTTLLVDPPILPLSYVDTTYSLPTGTTWIANSGAAFQSALNSAALNDVIVLSATTTYTGPFTLPNKASGSGWIYIISNMLGSLPGATSRVSPTDAANMPDIVVGVGSAAITADTNAHHYRFVGVEVKPIANNFIYALVDIGSGASFTTNGVMPHHIIFDRSYVHGDIVSPAGRRGIALNGTNLAVINSHISGFAEPGADTQAIWSYQGDGPLKIVNNYLEAGAENIMFGGSDPRITNSVPSDIEIRGNHFYKPLTWMSAGLVGKNLLEFKNGQRALIEGNYFENNYADAQSGYTLVITPRNQDGGCPWCVTQDITFRYNKMVNTGSGVSLMGQDRNPGYTSQLTNRVAIENNVIVANGLNGATGWGFLYTSGSHNVSIRHNTLLSSSFPGFTGCTATTTPSYMCINPEPYKQTGFAYKDNIVVGGIDTGYYEFIGDGLGTANSTLAAYFSNYTFTSNVLVGASSGTNPVGNFFPANTGLVGFTDYAGGDYSLTGGSTYHNAASDGTDIGVNMTVLNSLLSGSTSTLDTVPPSIPTGLTVTAVAQSSIFLSWLASTDNLSFPVYRIIRNGVGVATTSNLTYTNSGLSTSTLYSYTIAALDPHGNASATSTSVSTTTLP